MFQEISKSLLSLFGTKKVRVLVIGQFYAFAGNCADSKWYEILFVISDTRDTFLRHSEIPSSFFSITPSRRCEFSVKNSQDNWKLFAIDTKLFLPPFLPAKRRKIVRPKTVYRQFISEYLASHWNRELLTAKARACAPALNRNSVVQPQPLNSGGFCGACITLIRRCLRTIAEAKPRRRTPVNRQTDDPRYALGLS